MPATLILPVLLGLCQQDDAPRAVSYRIERAPDRGSRVEIHATLPGDADGSTELDVADRWGGVEAGGHDLTDLRVSGVDGAECSVERVEPHRWNVRHEPGEPLSVTYAIATNDHQASTDPATSRRPIVNAAIFHAIGQLFLVVPEHLDRESTRPITIEWGAFGEGASMACSFGAGPGPFELELSIDELVQSVFLAGEVELLPRDVAGQPVWLAAEDRGWSFELDELADLVAGTVEIERGFFEDFERPFFLVTLIPVGRARPGSSSSGGTGLTDSFALQIQPGLSFAPETGGYLRTARLLAHEMFHDWNGVLLKRDPPEELAYWFSEGFTDFYARRLMLRGGLISVDEYVDSLNDTLRRLHTSPVRNEPNERIRADYWNDRDVQALPYVRGDVVAMILDHAIRRASEDDRSLDGLMRELVGRARKDGWRASTAKLLEEASAWTSPEVAESIRAAVEDGALPAIDPDTFAPCLVLDDVEIGIFDVGFDLDSSMRDREVRGVRDGGPAHAAGLRNGQVFSRWSVRHGDTENPVRFTIEVDGVEREVEYVPVGERVFVPQFARAPGIDDYGIL